MAEHDYVVANATGASFRTDLNDVLAAIVSQNSKASDPTATFAHMLHMNTALGLLMQRDASNAAWKQVSMFKNLSKDIAGSSDTTLTASEAAHGVIELTGAVTGAKSVIWPASVPGLWLVRNATTGDYTVTLKPSGGTGVAVKLGERSVLLVYSDGTTLRELSRPQIKLVATTHDLSTATGTKAVTGFGGRPVAAVVIAAVNGTVKESSGFSEGATNKCRSQYSVGGTDVVATNGSACIALYQGGSDYVVGSVQTWDADGITFSLTKTGSPTGTADIYILALIQ